jgi:hypothetical protein
MRLSSTSRITKFWQIYTVGSLPRCGEALWIASRAGVYGCVPLLVAICFGLGPRPDMLAVPPIAFVAGFGWSCFGIVIARPRPSRRAARVRVRDLAHRGPCDESQARHIGSESLAIARSARPAIGARNCVAPGEPALA